MLISNAKALLPILGGVGSTVAVGGVVAGAYYWMTPELVMRIRRFPLEEKKMGKIFKAVEHNWGKNKSSPYILFKCVSSSCNSIDTFTEMTFKYGDNPLKEIYKCTGLTDGKKIPFYFFNQNVDANADPTDLDWSTLFQGTVEKRSWGQYIVIQISEKSPCGGSLDMKGENVDTDFWKNNFLMNGKWTKESKFTKDVSVFLKISGTEKQYWWRPIAPLAHDFDLDNIKSELKKYMPPQPKEEDE